MSISFQLKPKYFFGKGCLINLSQEIKKEYHNILFLYGGGSINKKNKLDWITSKNNSVYDIVKRELKKTKNNINIFEFGGIEPNPKDTKLDEAIKFCRDKKINLIIAIGGGSVIDSAKVIALIARNKEIGKTWDYVSNNYHNKELLKNRNFREPISIFSIITLAGTGSENNSGSVITNLKTKEKAAVMTPEAIPKVVFEDPLFTYSLSNWQMCSGIFDCLSHLLEQYYTNECFLWTEEIIFANIRTLLQSTSKLLKNSDDYDARANLLWTTSMSLNGLTSFNNNGADWNVHCIEHAISALWDVTHGAGLALITPTYIQVRCKNEKWFYDKTLKLAKNVFNVKTLKKFLCILNKFIKSLNLPTKYSDFTEIRKIDEHDFELIINHIINHGGSLSKECYYEILSQIEK